MPSILLCKHYGPVRQQIRTATAVECLVALLTLTNHSPLALLTLSLSLSIAINKDRLVSGADFKSHRQPSTIVSQMAHKLAAIEILFVLRNCLWLWTIRQQKCKNKAYWILFKIKTCVIPGTRTRNQLILGNYEYYSSEARSLNELASTHSDSRYRYILALTYKLDYCTRRPWVKSDTLE